MRRYAPTPPAGTAVSRSIVVFCVVLTTVSIGTVFAVGRAGAPAATQALIVLVGAAPLAVAVLTVSTRRRVWGAVGGAVGLVTAVCGVVLTVSTQALQLLRLDFSVLQVLTNAATTLAPLGLVAAGLALGVAGLACCLGDRMLAGVAAVAGVGVGTILTLALLASAFRSLRYQGGTVETAPVAAAATTAVATIGLIILTTRWWTLSTTASPAALRPRRAGSRSATRWTAVTVLVILAAGALWWGRDRFSARLDLAAMFPDPALAGCVAAALGTPVGEPVSERDLTGISDLACSSALAADHPVQGLAGLEHLPGLYRLDLTGQAVHDLRPLNQATQLSSLTLTSNAVSDLTPLTGLTALADLGLSGNHVTDLTPLGDLTTLQHLRLADNQIANLTPLAGLTSLQDLNLDRNQVADVAPLADLPQLDHLTLAGNQISDPSPLRGSPALTTLDLSRNRVTDAATVAACVTVTEVSIGANPLTDLRPLLKMPALVGVDLSGSDGNRLAGIQALRDRGVYVGGLA